ncbi:MAG: ABC transporter substrate-binding protein [Hyphomicrobiales bacterium]|nr:ABC transporter substrate-binding protein [Hyphomicrobiales bacterium]
MKSRLSLLAAGAFLVAASGASADTIKIGHISNFSGPFAVWGKQFSQAIKAYQKVHGDTVNGHKIELVYRDVGAVNPAKSRQLAEELILREKIKVLTGFSLTPNALAVAETITEAKMPTVIMNAATSVITRKSPYFVRVSMTVQQFIKPMPEYMVKKLNVKSAYVIVADYAPGHDAESIFVSEFTKNGGKVLGKDRFPLSTTDFAPFLERAANSNPDSVYIFSPAGAPSIAIIREFAKRGLKKKGIKLVGSGEIQEIYLAAIGDDVEGTYSSNHYTASNNSKPNELLKKTLHEMFGKDATPDIGSTAAWDGMDLIYGVVKKYGSKFTAQQFVDFAKTFKFNSPRGEGVRIDPAERDMINNVDIRIVVKKDGKLTNKVLETYKDVKDPWKEVHPVKK